MAFKNIFNINRRESNQCLCTRVGGEHEAGEHKRTWGQRIKLVTFC